MKKLLLLIGLMIFLTPICFAEWGLGGGNTTQEVNFYEAAEKKSPDAKSGSNGLSNGEATWNLDFEVFPFMMSDQPADDQLITTVSGLGVTYKFSDKIHVVGKIVQFELEGKKGTKWKHQHMLAGFGARSFFAKNTQQWQVNFMTGTSEVSESKLGKVKNLESPIFVDLKYLWAFGDSFFIGPEITFARIANKCNEINGTYMECGSGGYTSFGLTFQVGMPDNWGK